MKKKKQKSVIPQSRVYVHIDCGQQTMVDEEDFKGIANPVPGTGRTYCACCKGYFVLDEFMWADTGETIPDYYQKYRDELPPMVLFLGARSVAWSLLAISILLGIALGIWSGAALGTVWGVVIGIVISLVLAMLIIYFWYMWIDSMVIKRLDVMDVRMLK